MSSARLRWIRLACVAIASCLVAAGCFRFGPELAPVTGTVTLDGEPLANAQVQFQPTSHGPYSVGTTNSLGQYVLEYTKNKPGAEVGTHVVRITTETTTIDETGVETQIPQRIPGRYNDRSKLVVEVKRGDNLFDFPLTSEPDEPAPGEPEAVEPGEEKPETEPPAAKQPEAESPDAEAPKPEELKIDN